MEKFQVYETDFTHFSPDWQRCLKHWLASVRDKSGSDSTLESYSSTVMRFFAFVDKGPQLVTRADVASFIALPNAGRTRANQGRPISASTHNTRLSCIRALYEYASAYEVVQPDGNLAPLFSRVLPTTGMRASKRDSYPRAMDEDELARFFAAIDTTTQHGRRLHCLFYLFLLLGRRKMEIIRLRWRDVSPALLTGPDGTQRHGFVYRYIGKGDQRQVRQKELPANCYQKICDMLAGEGRLQTIKPDDAIFANIKGYGLPKGSAGQQMNGDYLSTQFHVIALKAGLNTDRLSLHSLRWSSARARSESGETLQAVQAALDHQHSETTLHYLQREMPSIDAGAAALERKFSFLR